MRLISDISLENQMRISASYMEAAFQSQDSGFNTSPLQYLIAFHAQALKQLQKVTPVYRQRLIIVYQAF